MRKDGKSQYQIKKEKLQEIKKIIIDPKGKYTEKDKNWKKDHLSMIVDIWEIVKDE